MKLKLTKSKEFKEHSDLSGMTQPRRQPLCEMVIPGVGRIRTAQMHENFHLVVSFSRDRVEISESPAVKKQEIVHVR
jgi:hypothetical protein